MIQSNSVKAFFLSFGFYGNIHRHALQSRLIGRKLNKCNLVYKKILLIPSHTTWFKRTAAN